MTEGERGRGVGGMRYSLRNHQCQQAREDKAEEAMMMNCYNQEILLLLSKKPQIYVLKP